MESRQVILLTKGYLAGWLNFEYPNKFSHMRESYITMQIEKDLTLGILAMRSAAQNQFIGVNPKEGGKSSQKVLDEYTRIALPYTYNQAKISKDSPKTADEWKALLAEMNKNK